MELNNSESLISQDIEFTCDYLFVGAGLFSMVAAGIALSAGHKIALIDKSRGLGGRLARRRVFMGDSQLSFYHGAPEECFPNDFEELKVRLKLHTSTEFLAQSLKPVGEGWEVSGQSTRKESSKVTGGVNTQATAQRVVYARRGVVLNPPLPQSLSLLQALKLDPSPLLDWLREGVQFYEPSLIAMVILPSELQQRFIEALSHSHYIFRLDQHQVTQQAVLLELSGSFVREHLEKRGADWFEVLINSLRLENRGLGLDFSQMKLVSDHRWRYARFNPSSEWVKAARRFCDTSVESINYSDSNPSNEGIGPIALRPNLWLAGDFLTQSNARDLEVLSASWAHQIFNKEKS